MWGEGVWSSLGSAPDIMCDQAEQLWHYTSALLRISSPVDIMSDQAVTSLLSVWQAYGRWRVTTKKFAAVSCTRLTKPPLVTARNLQTLLGALQLLKRCENTASLPPEKKSFPSKKNKKISSTLETVIKQHGEPTMLKNKAPPRQMSAKGLTVTNKAAPR